jgi:hypothetical protein
MDDDVTRYRKYAEECRRDALQTIGLPREKFLRIAVEWDALASFVEQRERGVESGVPAGSANEVALQEPFRRNRLNFTREPE